MPLYNKANMRKLKDKHFGLKKINPYVLVILSFVIVIFVGSVLLMMPFSQASGKWGNYMDALFQAVSATCVTGLCTYANGIGNELTFFGQFIMLLMIQIGGLGFVTVLTFFITLFKTKLEFKDRYLISQMVGSTSFADVIKFVRKIIIISLTAETIGALIGLPVFFEMFPDNKLLAVWNSIFTSVSAFNNAGFDLLGGMSFVRDPANTLIYNLPTWAYYYLLTYVMVLIVTGGISFLVIIDVFSFKKFSQYRVFSKIALITTAFLILSGFGLFLITETLFNHAGVFNALFQSVTLRTAGFASYSQDKLSLVGKVFSCILMLIGGSPLSTAGGIKTTTAFMIFLAMFCYFRGKQVVAFKRTYSANMIVKAMSLVFLAASIILTGIVCLAGFEYGTSIVEGLETDREMAIIYETFSAFGTVGVSIGITPLLTTGSKIVICFLMFLGRLGPITFLQIFQANMDKKQSLHYEYVEEDFLIG